MNTADAAVANLADEVNHLRNFGGVQPGQHLVEQQQSRLGGERARNFQPLLAGQGERARRRSGTLGQSNLLQHFERGGARGLQTKRFPSEARAYRDVVQHAHAIQRLHDLVRARQAQLHHLDRAKGR